MGPDSAQLTYAFAFLTYMFLGAGALFGIARFALAGRDIPKLASPSRFPDVTLTHIATKMTSGLAFLAVNVINLSLAVSIGIEEQFRYDARDLLSYVSTSTPSNDTVMLALLTSSLLRMIGTIALLHGVNSIAEWGHRDYQISKSARRKVIWGFFCGLVMWFPEFWTAFFGQYYLPLQGISEFLQSTDMLNR